mmetsp:Transcript_14043/g.39935  ORF Transcript_14043/g.39935 Transcript_14043/m.39935 type:complete len:150 (-) Transcript_14043:185-634(-)
MGHGESTTCCESRCCKEKDEAELEVVYSISWRNKPSEDTDSHGRPFYFYPVAYADFAAAGGSQEVVEMRDNEESRQGLKWGNLAPSTAPPPPARPRGDDEGAAAKEATGWHIGPDCDDARQSNMRFQMVGSGAHRGTPGELQSLSSFSV